MNAILFISIFIVSILIFTIIFIHKSKVKEHINLPNNEVINSNYQLPNSIKLNDECNILIDQTKVTGELNNLPEITDSKILKKINVLIPHVLDASRNLIQTQQLLDAGKQIKDFNASIPKNIVEVIIPPNAKLHESKVMKGAYRGSFTDNGKLGQANLKPVKIQNLKEINPSKMLNCAADAMNIASVVVGQYYMAEIDNKLESLNENVEEIKEFLNNERLAKVKNLITNVSIVSKYKDEILSNNQAITQELAKLSDYEEKASDILTHINHEINDIVKNHIDSFSEYQNTVIKSEHLLVQQNILVQTMNQIASLKYILYKGSMSTEYCYEKFNRAFSDSYSVRENIQSFHDKLTTKLNIDLENQRYLRNNLLNNVARPIIEVIHDEWNYEKIDEVFVNKILEQKNKQIIQPKALNVFDQETKVLIHGGKAYYSPKIL